MGLVWYSPEEITKVLSNRTDWRGKATTNAFERKTMDDQLDILVADIERIEIEA